MWYVIQAYGGREEYTAELMQRQLPKQCLTDCFIPVREKERKFHGTWNRVREVLFPGYIFVESPMPEKLFEQLKKVTQLTKLLGGEESHFIPLTDREVKFILSIGDEKHISGISQIRIGSGAEEKKTIEVCSGPLKGKEGQIVRINLHRREVVVKMEFMGKETEIFLGIEMVGETSIGK